ncbi:MULTISPECIES: dTDP-glucose 4,6-dehydratase [Mycobacterium]|uniref:dTDP-glucose 4,6-dehydratase n=1 Tax=Mycobacterium TaxID=1763 RepID=UPI001EF0158E|nr:MULTISPECIES: NAD-dependent epimerase/dehydratase family protein [Mycobacterium]GLB90803.1 dTDP-glucose 4,6-dehydratase [Mycobacterium kiyosense]GLC12278.1 dTDP-glucose 4,6-dehydratase [Mycobacterium kiyosense]GLD06705.1 dTDP-glucose 4,6-dehydratase [Mycobacterium kiyosense]GLD12801.1 dTDP-glucose 4,6-dehydratase [Mycobacterium kiyosense]
MRILVTGGAGFQGSHLVEALLAAGHQVTVLNTLSTAAKRNLRNIETHPRADVVFGSVTDPELAVKTVPEHDVIFHLAANVNVDKSLSDPKSFLDTNVMGTYNILEAARRCHARVIYASTCEVYGDGQSLGAHELLHESAELMPNSPYGASKAAADRLCYSYYRSYDMDVTIVRPFNIFGERQKSGAFGALIPILVRHALSGRNLTIFGKGTATRDYLHVSDVVRAYQLVLDTLTLQGRAINFASGTNTSVRDIANYIADRFGVRVFEGPARPGEVSRYPADITLARDIGFAPHVDIWTGIDRYIDWAKGQPDNDIQP